MIDIKKYETEMKKALAELVAIPSVSSERNGVYPFGNECAKALDAVLNLCSGLGFETRNYDYYAGSADFNSNEAALGILTHIDVVPVNKNDWTSDPFTLTERDGKLFGRGAIDDKGPTVAAIFALKAIKDSGIELKKGVRLIIGASEETGCELDIKHYNECAKMPPMVFSPDADFPVITTEKGMIHFAFEKKVQLKNIVSVNAGTVINAVPNAAVAVLKGIPEHDARAVPNDRIAISAENDGTLKIVYSGKAGHASMPETADNAITGLFEYLNKLPLENDDKALVESICRLFPHGDFHGSGLDIAVTDISGVLTCVLSMISTTADKFNASVDIRYPVTLTKEAVKSQIEKEVHKYGYEFAFFDANDPHSVDNNSDFVKTLLSAYTDVTGLEGYCCSKGGGTYVHYIDGGVAFGMEYPDEDSNMHGADEFVKISNLLQAAQVYAEAIIRICS